MEKQTKIMTLREALKEAMSEEMRRDENVFLMGEDVGIFGGDFGTTVGMLEEFGEERVRDCPISEAAIAGAAAGAASVGMRPIVDMTFMDFVTIAMDAIVNEAAPMRYMLGGEVSVPVVYRCASGCGTGSAAQHSKALESWFCHIPGLKVVAPGTVNDVYGILKASIRDNNPVIFIEPKALFGRKGEVNGGEVSVPVVYRCASGCGTGSAAQHSKALESWFCHIPGLKVVAPGTVNDVYGILKASIRDNNPVIFIEPKALFGRKGEVNVGELVEIGKGEVKIEGKDITLVSWGRMLERALQAAQDLKEENISVEVVDPITLVPLDEEIIVNSVKKTGKLVICHDSFKTGGFGGEISARIAESDAFDYLDAPIYRLAGMDTNIPSAKNLEDVIVPSVDDIKNTIRKALNK